MYDHRPAFGFSDSSDDDDAADHARDSSRRRHARPSKDSQMLGIWASDDEDNPAATATNAANQRSRAGADSAHPLAFVSEQEPNNRAHATGYGSEPDDDRQSDSSSETDGTTSASESSSSARSELAQPSSGDNSATPSLPPPPPSKEFGKFASSAVWGMMAKMGYRHGEGLGKHGEGRVEPVQVRLRRAGEGISFSGSEAPRDHPNAPSSSKPPGTRRVRDISAPAAAINTTTTPGEAQSKARRRKLEYKTLEEIELRTDAKLTELFVDMRSNTEAGSLADLLAATMPQTEREKLISDTRLGLDLAFARLEDLVRERDVQVARNKALHSEVTSLTQCVAARSVRIEGLHAIDGAIAAVYAASRDVPQIENISSAAEDLAALYSSFECMRSTASRVTKKCRFDVWGELRLERVVTDSIHSHLARLFRTWDPTTHPDFAASLITPLRPFVRISASTSSDDAFAETTTPFESLLSKSLVPRLKQYIYTEWDSSTDTLSNTLACLPPVVAAELSAALVSSLQRGVEAVNPRLVVEQYKLAASLGADARRSSLAALRLDHSVIPWLPFISNPTELLVCVRRKLSTAIDCWPLSKDTNEDIILLVAPWMHVLHGKELRRLATSVADRLKSMLRSEFAFNAQKQVLWPFKALLKWRHSMPQDIWLPLVRSTVLRGFLDYLRRWLEDPDANYAEIADWYWQWKLLYPIDVRDSPDIQDAFRDALVYMAYALSQE
ncbi:hypothetical protein H4R20_002312 [Coemansia guatemalensis]|uniref:G-patch domain-containing protein n=1 Tax=Coemansia guatemalensis TaxID=2761395 RepID=A0A9W8HXG2_9FUNG|nr:hypothetical protein H4R20_002312 [Coemansia guatemalensis]